ncbi:MULTISPECIES: hypothetical protein [Streptomyces]|uniref:Uncharacterized protein n=1 Tax=Streptomyces kaempferi TaxID=333725 RepID=A0ABW3XCL6_9ACTN|nr:MULTISPECIES: hypothetical protein [unclassified Streptomyces]QIY60687.1 hypothetical protein HEP85_01995 [Streptomyces sp. RPA4-2]
MISAPVVVSEPPLAAGRTVTMRRCGRDEILGTARSDRDLMVFLEAVRGLLVTRIRRDTLVLEALLNGTTDRVRCHAVP